MSRRQYTSYFSKLASVYHTPQAHHNARVPYHRLQHFDFHQRVAHTPGTSILFFTNEGCGNCKRWKEVLQNYPDGDITVFEVDAAIDQGLTREFAVFFLPTLFLFRAGHYHCPLQSEAHPEKLREAIAKALAQPAQEPP